MLLVVIFSAIMVLTFAMAKLSSELSRQEEKKEIHKKVV